MNKLYALLITTLLSTTASADITGLVIPPSPGGYSGGGFTPSSAHGFYGAPTGGFDNHWLVTVDGPASSLMFTVVNSFNPGNGAGAVGFSLLTVTGPGVPGVALAAVPTPCNPLNYSCEQSFAGTFAVAAGTYDLHVVGGGAFQWAYSMTATVVPEPGTAALAGAGLLLLISRVNRRRGGNRSHRG